MKKTYRFVFPLSALFVLVIACSTSASPVVVTSPPAPTALITGPATTSTSAAAGPVISPGAAPAASSAASTAAPVAEPAAAAPPAGVRVLHLTGVGEARPLPANILGASVEAMIEHLLDNPQKVAAVQQTAPGVIRFPGGSQSNYYDWKTGQLALNPQPDSSAYYKFWAGVAPKINRAFPTGVHMEQYQTLAAQIAADVILVPNLETSSVSDQAAWFNQLAADHSLPKTIELGNEFYIAMANDPHVIRQWPDEPASLAVMKQYADALRPLVGPGAKFAIQSAGAAFTTLSGTSARFAQRLLAWDAALAPADWFQAVTIHLYPDPGKIVQQAGNPGPDKRFQLFMGRADAGVDRALNDLAARLPGKEIWITEWSPIGGNAWQASSNPDVVVPPQMNAQLAASETLAILRHPAVTRSLYFTLNGDGNSPFEVYVAGASGSYAPMPVALVLQWFDEAANHGGTFQRVVDNGSQPLTGLGEFSESYRPVEGGLFHSASGTTLIVQNASAEPLWYDPTQAGQNPHPARVEVLAADFSDVTRAAARVQTLDPSAPVTIPPFSLVRMVWTAP
jgi:hypothetical protein